MRDSYFAIRKHSRHYQTLKFINHQILFSLLAINDVLYISFIKKCQSYIIQVVMLVIYASRYIFTAVVMNIISYETTDKDLQCISNKHTLITVLQEFHE